MNKVLIVGFFLALAASQASFASADNHYLGDKSLRVAERLNEIVRANDGDLCAGDIRIAAAYVQSAGYVLLGNKIQTASVSLVYAQNELREIGYNRSYCVNQASSIKPYLAQVILIKDDLDALNIAQHPDKKSD